MENPNYLGKSKAATAPGPSRLLSFGLGVDPPIYTGDPSTEAGAGHSSPGVIKRITFTVLSPQLSRNAEPAAATVAESSSPRSSGRAGLADPSTVVRGPGPVAKSQPVVIAVPDKAKSYAIVSGLIAYPASAGSVAIPAIPSATPVAIDQPPRAEFAAGDAQLEVTVSWMLLPGAVIANAGEYKTLLTVEFYG